MSDSCLDNVIIHEQQVKTGLGWKLTKVEVLNNIRTVNIKDKKR